MGNWSYVFDYTVYVFFTQHAIEGLMDLIKSQVRHVELSLFFWQHLNHDIVIISRALAKSRDDVCLLLHLLLKDMITLPVPTIRKYYTLYVNEKLWL